MHLLPSASLRDGFRFDDRWQQARTNRTHTYVSRAALGHAPHPECVTQHQGNENELIKKKDNDKKRMMR